MLFHFFLALALTLALHAFCVLFSIVLQWVQCLKRRTQNKFNYTLRTQQRVWRKIIITTRVINRSETKTQKSEERERKNEMRNFNHATLSGWITNAREWKDFIRCERFLFTHRIAVGECQTLLLAHNEYLIFKFGLCILYYVCGCVSKARRF